MNINEPDSTVVEIFWRAQEPLSVNDVVAALHSDSDWSADTIRTFLARLVKKNALAITPDGRYVYRPLAIRRENYVYMQSRNLIDTLFGGRVAPFVAQFLERKDLSPDEIEEIKALILCRLKTG
ncbi:MAG TPA: BlaI/MecI/CopY family transcriptional regulator [Gammaproteobacteria bacterium]|nr:BlaI/MecI/CopY family transcriptional regulator [Gammaproteobacteria bacterium]